MLMIINGIFPLNDGLDLRPDAKIAKDRPSPLSPVHILRLSLIANFNYKITPTWKWDHCQGVLSI